MKAILDHGHKFELLTLDGEGSQTLQFVKRTDLNPDKFPGNNGTHEGTTLQSVLRVLHSRVCFLNSQHHCAENIEIISCLRRANWLLESRASQRHGSAYLLSEDEAIDAPMCAKCGHTKCEHNEDTPTDSNAQTHTDIERREG